jgi:uncharacterized protein (DUF1501 family)
MLTMKSGRNDRDCQRVSRRDFMQIGALSTSGLTLPDLLATRATAADLDPNSVRDKSIVLLYLSGGASHIETFDPKMSAPEGTRSITGEVATNIPGVTFGGTFPKLATHADKLAVVRSFTHRVGSHEQAHVHVLSGGTDPVGKQQTGFSMGAYYARMRGTNHLATGMPTFSLLTESEVDGQFRKEFSRVHKGSWPGHLGPSFAPFEHQVGWRNDDAVDDKRKSKQRSKAVRNPIAESMKLNLPQQVLEDRVQLLQSIDRLKRNVDTSGNMNAVDHFTAQAMDLILGKAVDAFDYRREPKSLVERYDTSHIQIGHKTFRPSTLGKQMLVARRLCESGCGFVTVHSAGWDMHADSNNPGMVRGMDMLGRSLDIAVSTFLEDVEQRGLSDKILLVITGDFGRTPRVNKKGGRDHWAKLGTLAFAGGGLPMGQVIGQSASRLDVPASEPLTTTNMMATIIHTLFDVGKLRLRQGIPRELLQLTEVGEPIKQLF